MRLLTLMWASYLPSFTAACARAGVTLTAYSTKQVQLQPENLDAIRRDLAGQDCILLYRTSDPFWEDLEPAIGDAGVRCPVVVVGGEPSLWGLGSVPPEVAATSYRYLLYNGAENLDQLLRYLAATLLGRGITFEDPRPVAWEGLYHPGLGQIYASSEAYLADYARRLGFTPETQVGLLLSRTNWVNGNLEVERSLIAALEARRVGVIPAFYYSVQDAMLGNLSGAQVIDRFFLANGIPRVQAVVKLNAFFLAGAPGEGSGMDDLPGVALLRRLNVPLFCPVVSYYQDRAQWLADPQGLGAQVGWSIAMPEFEGGIEPLILGASSGADRPEEERTEPIPDRIAHVAERVAAWAALGRTPNAEKRVAFILHNNPCASVEATVGGGAHLDTLESVAWILWQMQAAGYAVTAPPDGKALIDTIMRRKAISEFRWTTTDEIVAQGGTLDQVEPTRYRTWFDELPAATQARMSAAWGDPPGEARDGIPAAMIHEGKLVITGVRYGNAVVCVQPKRGCAGARCDGQVCKILHDPDVPPPHQYVATYKWLAREFGAHVMIHVGTHGNLEFLPGKSTGLSAGCFPDIGIDRMPHLYIYNADNPAEGTTAKRRSAATLVNHLQTVMVPGELYGDLDTLDRLLEDWKRHHQGEPGKAHTIAHLIVEKAKGLGILDERAGHDHAAMASHVTAIHDALTLLRNTRIPKGMHVFGAIPEGERLAEFVYAVVRYEKGPGSLRGLVALALVPGAPEAESEFAERVDAVARRLCIDYLVQGTPLAEGLAALGGVTQPDPQVVKAAQEAIDDIRRRTLLSDEMEALLGGFRGGYVPPGPSGLLTRGRPDILPTGRNSYSLDPYKIPSPAAWQTGVALAEQTLEKYRRETGGYPENVAFYWQSTDIMWADGEGMAQMLHLLGVTPIWQSNGRVRSVRVVPLGALGRPRVDITVRVSGILRDCFPAAIDLVDEAVQEVAVLPEPPTLNFVRKRTLEALGGEAAEGEALRRATFRLFASQPGTYQAGTQLAVYASAWKTEADLADVFLYWNGYAYGKGSFGVPAHASLKQRLASVSLTFNKTVSDEYDLTGCCCHFGTHGGLIAAARAISGHDIPHYYGDTREQGEVAIRTLAEEMRRVARGKILNPVWIEGMKAHGYKGAGEISKRVGRLYGWQATAHVVDDSVFDDVARTFLMDKENRRFFEQENPWALEEMTRRLLEAAQRGLWSPAEDVRDQLQTLYLEIEGWIEERMGETQGDYQGGSIDMVTADEVANWKQRMREVLG